MDSVKKVAFSGFLWTTIENFGTKVLSLIIFLAFAKFLSPNDFGVFALAKVFVDFTAIFINYSFSSVLIYKENLSEEDKSTSFWTNIILGIVLFFIFYTGANFVAEMYDNKDLVSLLKWLSLSLIILSMDSVQTALLKRAFKFKSLAIRVFFSELIAGSVSIILIINNFGIHTLVVYHLLNAGLKVLFLFLVSEWRPKFIFDIKSLKENFNFGANIIGVRISEYVSKRGDDLIVGYFLGTIALGLYVVAYKIMRVLEDLFAKIITKVTFPIFSRFQNDKENFKNYFIKFFGLLILLIVPVFLILFLNTPFVVINFFGEEWKDSVIIMQVLMLLGIIQSFGNYFRQVIVSLGAPNIVFKISSLTTFFLILAVFIGAQFSLLHVSIAVLIVNAIIIPIYLSIIKTKIDFSFDELFIMSKNIIIGCLIFFIFGLILRLFLISNTLAYFIINNLMFIVILSFIILKFEKSKIDFIVKQMRKNK